MIRIDTLHVHVQVDTDRILGVLGEIAARQEFLISRMEDSLMASAEMIAVLDQINELTNQLAAAQSRMATAQSAQAAKLTEVSADIDDLLANQSVDPTVKTRLEATRDALQAAAGIAKDAADTAEQTSATLTQIAAKHDAPIPAPSDGATT